MIELIPNEWRYRDAETKQICPWYVKPVVEMLYGMDLSNKDVFEYGAGDSTLWYRSKGAWVSGVDTNLEWANKALVDFASDKKSYIESIGPRKYNIIAIDGSYRDDCLGVAKHHLVDGGIIIIDNFEQEDVDPHWPMTRDNIINENMKIEIFREEGHPTWKTAIIRP